MRFTIEQMGSDGRWFIRGSERYESDAMHYAMRYAVEHGTAPFRVRDALTGRIFEVTTKVEVKPS